MDYHNLAPVKISINMVFQFQESPFPKLMKFLVRMQLNSRPFSPHASTIRPSFSLLTYTHKFQHSAQAYIFNIPDQHLSFWTLPFKYSDQVYQTFHSEIARLQPKISTLIVSI